MDTQILHQHLNDLRGFADKSWGAPQALLKKLQPQGLEVVALDEYFPALKFFFSGILQDTRILVRDEYRTALQALQTGTRYKKGAYITGQPGIGKTYFLVYALIHFLGQKQPVALQLLTDHRLYLLFTNTTTIYPLDDGTPLYDYPLVWALCDSNLKVEHPDKIFMSPPQIRIIQTTSPEAARWKAWSKQIGAKRYVMDIWSDEEIVHLAVLNELDPERMAALANDWGNIPRILLDHIHEDDYMVEDEYRKCAAQAVRECANITHRAAVLDLPDEVSSSFYFIRPVKTDEGTIDHRRFYVYVPTRRLRFLLGEALQGQDNNIKLRFYNTLSHIAETRQTAGFIFESWFHSFVTTGDKMHCHWLTKGTHDHRVQLPAMLQGSNNLAPGTQDALKSWTPPYYWIPSTMYLPGIDSALVLETAIFAFQVTISSEHRTPIKGMRKLRNALPQSLKSLPWRVVFVGHMEDPIKTTAEAWAGKLSFPEKETCVPVAWTAVDPVKDEMTYKPYRDESDSMPTESNEEMMKVEVE